MTSQQYDLIIKLSLAGNSNLQIADALDISLQTLLRNKRKIRNDGIALPFHRSKGRPTKTPQKPTSEQVEQIINLANQGYHVRQIAIELNKKDSMIYRWKKLIESELDITFPRARIQPYICTIAEYNKMLASE